jgi:3-methyladenine DNA glycosylase AlkD
MTFKETMAELKKLGTAQNRKVYERHGAGKKMYGVSYAALTAMKKKIKQDHDLAVKLWNTGNHAYSRRHSAMQAALMFLPGDSPMDNPPSTSGGCIGLTGAT